MVHVGQFNGQQIPNGNDPCRILIILCYVEDVGKINSLSVWYKYDY